MALYRHRGFRVLDVDVSPVHQELAVIFGESKNHRARGEFFLPIEASTVLHEYLLDAEAGVNFVQYGSTQLVAGAIVAHSCGRNLECLGEVRRVFVSHDSRTLLNFGLHWKLNESMVVLAAAGREFGPRTDDQQHLLVYLGLQLLR